MQRSQRLTSEKRFTLIHDEGRSWSNRLLVLKVIPNGLDRTRFGLVTSKRVGNAVVRNRVKRRLREDARSMKVNPGWDAAVIARKEAANANYHQLKQALDSLLNRANLLRSCGPGDGKK